MRDRPSGADLVALGAALAVPGEEDLVERCRAIAAREAATGDGGWAECRAALRALYHEDDRDESAGDALYRRLASDIRRGLYDRPGAARDAVCALLRQVTHRKLRDANPDFIGDPETIAPPHLRGV